MSKGSSGSTTTVQKADPWKEAQPYLLDVMQQATDMYGSGTAPYMPAQMATLPSWASNSLLGAIQSGIGNAGDWTQIGMEALLPSLFPNAPGYLGVNEMGGAPGVQQYGVNEAPAVWQTLYGGVSNPYISGMADDLVNRTQQMWGDQAKTVQDTLQNQVLPGIESQFNTAGQLGQSRQALFEGKAIGDAQTALGKYSRDLGTSLAGQLSNLYGGLYENAAGRSANLAGQLAGQTGAVNQANASLMMQAMLANMQAQQMNQQADLEAQKLGLQGGALSQNALSMLPQLAGMETGLIGQQLQAYNPLLAQEQGLMDLALQNYYTQQAAPWDYLANYAQNFIFPAAGMGSMTTSKTPTYSNPLSNALGGYMMGNMLASGLGSMTTGFAAAPFMAAMPWLGLLGGLFM